jgi:predicted membrane channel-forming protein YqfA (hemolysin III family)
MQMSDGKKSCLGFGFLILALSLAGVSVIAGGISSLVSNLSGEAPWFDLKTGVYVAIGLFVLFALIALLFFISVRNWSWFPAIFGGVYAILPDLIFGPEDDVIALVLGVVLSGALAYFRERRGSGSTLELD